MSGTLAEPWTTITRRAAFAAGHRLWVSEWDEHENVAVFGKCANAGGHGHNYVIEVTVGGEVDETTGMLADLSWIDSVMNSEVVLWVDHRNLNTEVPFLAHVNPTAENLAREFWKRLAAPLSARARLVRVRVIETDKNSATCEA